jgi:hypothetical protein
MPALFWEIRRKCKRVPQGRLKIAQDVRVYVRTSWMR